MRAQAVAVRGDQHRAAGPQVGDDAGLPVGQHPGDDVLEALGAGHLVAEVGVPRVADLGELVVVVQRRRGHVEAAAPEHELLLAVLRERLLLVLALEGAVVPLVEPPGAAHRDPVPVGRVEGEVGRGDGPALAARCARRRAAARPRGSAARRRTASARPFSVRSTSTQPVKRFLAFHSLSPWRSRTRVIVGSWHVTPCSSAVSDGSLGHRADGSAVEALVDAGVGDDRHLHRHPLAGVEAERRAETKFAGGEVAADRDAARRRRG